MTEGSWARRVFVASPYRGDEAANIAYAVACMRHSLARGEAPFLPHLLYPRVLKDAVSVERVRGMRAGLAWLRFSDALAVYEDLGVSDGMRFELEAAARWRIPVERRSAWV